VKATHKLRLRHAAAGLVAAGAVVTGLIGAPQAVAAPASSGSTTVPKPKPTPSLTPNTTGILSQSPGWVLPGKGRPPGSDKALPPWYHGTFY
jgi:hypothetical protein